jgi:hypothetical protein
MCSLPRNTIKTIEYLNSNRTTETFQKFFIHVRFEVIMAVTMKREVLLVVISHTSEKARCFRRTYQLHLQVQRVNQARNWQKRAASWAELATSFCWFLVWLTLRSWGCSSKMSGSLHTTQCYNLGEFTQLWDITSI